MLVHNVHERVLEAPAEAVGALLDTLGGPDDALWPSPTWPPLVLDRPLAVGAAGGHGSLRYDVSAYEQGRRVEFRTEPGQGLTGTHTFDVTPLGPARTRLRHVVPAEATGAMRLIWPGVLRFVHDAMVEALLDRADEALGVGPARRSHASRVLRWLGRPRVRATAVPDSPLLATALPRVDFADAFAVALRPGMSTDPQVWMAAFLVDPPGWVRALGRLRDALVGLVGIERSTPSTFAVRARTATEAAAGGAARHLDFRAVVTVEPRRIVLSTVVQLHNRRGRAYFALIRHIHPAVVAAMLDGAAARLARPGITRGGRKSTSTGEKCAGRPALPAVPGSIGDR